MSLFHGKNCIFKPNLGTLSCFCEITLFWTKKCVLRLAKWENTSKLSPNKRICAQTLPKWFYATFSKIQNFAFFSISENENFPSIFSGCRLWCIFVQNSLYFGFQIAPRCQELIKTPWHVYSKVALGHEESSKKQNIVIRHVGKKLSRKKRGGVYSPPPATKLTFLPHGDPVGC